MDKFNFTQASLEAISPPQKGKRLYLKDTQVLGLQCRVTDNGIKTFSVYRRIKNGQSERITLGRFGDISVKAARDEAKLIIAAIAQGMNPAQVKRVTKAEKNFDELFSDYIELHSKVKKGTWKQDLGKYEMYLKKPLGKTKVSQISRTDIVNLHSAISSQPKKRKIKKDGEIKLISGGTANRVLALISSVFNWGIYTGRCENNPAKGVRKNTERSRDRFLQADEIPRFFMSLAQEENATIRDFLLIALLTGARRANVMSMRWEEISFPRKEWRIPKTKNGESQVIPLGDEALQILTERAQNMVSEYVFPSEGKAGHLIEPKKGWERILKRANIKELRIHDLRRTLGSWQARTGASLIIVGKSLGHKSPQSTAIYSRLDLDPVRKSVEVATQAMLKVAGIRFHFAKACVRKKSQKNFFATTLQ
ncbi:Integrase [Flavobacterium longum]|uniref:tyrosine-type recombinase/integrase n=1 Tax=Flavobacterium longum TaxID=1299340 RepID=UPI0039E87A8D